MGGKASAFTSAACSSGEQAALCQQPPHSAAPPAQVILCFSPVGSTLRVRARRFPAVVNCTAIDWFHEWPEDALVSVSSRFLEETGDIEVSAAGPRVRAQRTARGAAAAFCSLLMGPQRWERGRAPSWCWYQGLQPHAVHVGRNSCP